MSFKRGVTRTWELSSGDESSDEDKTNSKMSESTGFRIDSSTNVNDLNKLLSNANNKTPSKTEDIVLSDFKTSLEMLAEGRDEVVNYGMKFKSENKKNPVMMMVNDTEEDENRIIEVYRANANACKKMLEFSSVKILYILYTILTDLDFMALMSEEDVYAGLQTNNDAPFTSKMLKYLASRHENLLELSSEIKSTFSKLESPRGSNDDNKKENGFNVNDLDDFDNFRLKQNRECYIQSLCLVSFLQLMCTPEDEDVRMKLDTLIEWYVEVCVPYIRILKPQNAIITMEFSRHEVFEFYHSEYHFAKEFRQELVKEFKRKIVFVGDIFSWSRYFMKAMYLYVGIGFSGDKMKTLLDEAIKILKLSGTEVEIKVNGYHLPSKIDQKTWDIVAKLLILATPFKIFNVSVHEHETEDDSDNHGDSDDHAGPVLKVYIWCFLCLHNKG